MSHLERKLRGEPLQARWAGRHLLGASLSGNQTTCCWLSLACTNARSPRRQLFTPPLQPWCSTMGLLCSLSMHVNGGMSRFVFSLFIKLKKKKSFQLKLAASPDLIMLISLISTIRQRQDQKQADIWALRIVVDSIMFAVLSRERARETFTFAAAALHDAVAQDRCNYDCSRILLRLPRLWPPSRNTDLCRASKPRLNQQSQMDSSAFSCCYSDFHFNVSMG